MEWDLYYIYNLLLTINIYNKIQQEFIFKIEDLDKFRYELLINHKFQIAPPNLK